jgi:ankyrin repeat protein
MQVLNQEGQLKNVGKNTDSIPLIKDLDPEFLLEPRKQPARQRRSPHPPPSEPHFDSNLRLWQVSIPIEEDPSSLFWSVALAYLIPVKQDDSEFQERFKKLFPYQNPHQNKNPNRLKQIEREQIDHSLKNYEDKRKHIRTLIQDYNPFLDTSRFYQNKIFHELIQQFRNRIISDPEAQISDREIKEISRVLRCKFRIIEGANFRDISAYRTDLPLLQLSLFHTVPGTEESERRPYYHFGLEKQVGDPLFSKKVYFPSSWKLDVDKNLKRSHPNYLAEMLPHAGSSELTHEEKLDALRNPTPSYPDDYLLAQLAYRVYKEKEDGGEALDEVSGPLSMKIPRPLSEGWKLLTTAYHPGMRNGYFGAAYWNVDKRQVVIAHRGTKPKNLGSVWTDVKGIIYGYDTAQMKSAVTFTHEIIDQLNELNKRYGIPFHLSFTGHSLGGWLAQITAFTARYLRREEDNFIKNEIKNEDVQPGYPSHTVVFDSPGCRPMLAGIQDRFDVRYRGRSSSLDTLDITSYLSVPNLINTRNKHVGVLYRVFIDLSEISKMNFFKKKTPSFDFATHKIKEIKKIFDLKGNILKDENGHLKIQEVLDWPISEFLSSETEYSDFYRWADQFNNYDPKPVNDRFGRTLIRYQTRAIDEQRRNLNVFTEVERDFLEKYAQLRSLYRPEFLLSSLKDEYMVSKAKELLGTFDIEIDKVGARWIVCREAGRLRSLIAYVKTLLNLFPETKAEVMGMEIISEVLKPKEYIGALKNKAQKFKGTNRIDTISHFLASGQKIMQLTVSKHTLLGMIKVYKQVQEVKNDSGEPAFVYLRYLLESQDKLNFMDFLKTRATDYLLVIECEPSHELTEDLKKFFRELLDVFKANQKIRLVLVTKKDTGVSDFLKEQIRPYPITEDKEISLSDLEDSFQDILLKEKITFQGGEISLDQLISDLQPVDPDMLNQLIENNWGLTESKNKINVGKELPDSTDYDEAYYIERTFNQKITIKEEVLNDPKFPDLLAHTEREFQQLCQQHPNRHVHWLNSEADRIVWQQSQGSLKHLREYMDTHQSHAYPPEHLNDFLNQAQRHRVMLISDTAGMGKTTVLTHLSRQIKQRTPAQWVVRIDLKGHTDALKAHTDVANKQIKEAFTPDSAVEFLAKKLLRLETPLEQRLFEQCFKQDGKIKAVLLFDGFDEISPTYKNTVLNLLHVLKNTPVEQLWVTTRPHMKESLENQLQQFSYTLERFSEANQIEFSIKFWRKELGLQEASQERLTTYAKALIQKLAQSISDQETEFTGIPLQTRLLAEGFDKEVKEANRLAKETLELPDKLDLLDLYQKFLEAKNELFLKKGEIAIKEQSGITNKGISINKNYHQLALQELFTPEQIKPLTLELLNEGEQLSNEALARIGIVQVIEGKPHFIHRTFAEYFIASWLEDQLKKSQDTETLASWFMNFLGQSDYPVIHLFLNSHLKEPLSKNEQWLNRWFNPCGKQIHQRWSEPSTRKGPLVYNHDNPWLMSFKEQRLVLKNNFYNEQGQTALHLAAQAGHRHIIDFLFKSLKENHEKTLRELIDAPDTGKETALHRAAAQGHLETVQLLLENSANIEAKGDKNWTPLHRAANHGHRDIVQLLLNQNANKEASTEYNRTPLHCAACEGHLGTVELLLEQGANIEAIDKDGQTPLHEAADRGHLEVVQLLLDRSANMEGGDSINRTPLYLAAKEGHRKTVQLLLERGANMEAKDKRGLTPLHIAAFWHRLETVQLLLERGAIYNACDSQDKTPLQLTQQLIPQRTRSKKIKQLLSVTDKLFNDAKSGNLDALTDSLNKGAAVHARNNDGKTPLQLAVQENHLAVALTLIKQGAKVDVLNEQQKMQVGLFLSQQPLEEPGQPVSSVEPCLTKKRRKRHIDTCLFTWDDVDEFNEEKSNPRDKSKIRINSDAFLRAIQGIPESKQAQLIQLASEAQIVGTTQAQVKQLIHQQKVQYHFQRVGQVSGLVTHGLITKDTLAAFLRGDYEDAAVNIGFLTGSQALGKLSERTMLQGSELILNGKQLLGRSLKMASPFLNRGTSALIAYDLVQQLKAWKAGDPEAFVNVMGDSIFVGIDVVECGIEVAEMAEWLEGVSAFSGPIGAALGALVMVGTQIYRSIKQVDQIEALVHLSRTEHFLEGLRALIGMRPEHSIQELIALEQGYQQRITQGLQFLKNHPEITRYIVSTLKPIERCRTITQRKEICERGGEIRGHCVIGTGMYYTKTHQACETDFQVEQNSTVLLNRPKANVQWGHLQPLKPTGGEVFCLPSNESTPSQDTYHCDKALGIAELTQPTVNYTLVTLGEGYDYSRGFRDSPTIFIVNNGFKKFYGGDKEDTFLLQGDRISGDLHGGQGINTLDCSDWAPQADTVQIFLNQRYLTENKHHSNLGLFQIQHVVGRSGKADHLEASCDTHTLDGRGGHPTGRWDTITIPHHTHCVYNLHLILRSQTRVEQQANRGQFNYTFPAGQGEVIVDLSTVSPEAHHRFLFNYTLADLERVQFTPLNATESARALRFHFLTAAAIQEDNALMEHIDQLQLSKAASHATATLVLRFKPDESDGAESITFTRSIPVAACQAILAAYDQTTTAHFSFTFTQPDTILHIYRQLVARGAFYHAQRPLWTLTVLNPSQNATYHLQDTEIKIGQRNRLYALHTTDRPLETILTFYPLLANRLGMNLMVQRPIPLSQETIMIGHSHHDVLSNDPLYPSHLVGQGGNNLYVMTVTEAMQNVFQLPMVTLYDCNREANTTDTLDLRPVTQRIQANTTQAVHVHLQSYQDHSLALSLIAQDHVYLTLRLHHALRNHWYQTVRVILHQAPMKLTHNKTHWDLKPLPLSFGPDKQVIVITPEDVESGTELRIAKKIGRPTWARSGTDLILTNAFHFGIEEGEFCTLTLHRFYQDQKMHTLSVRFTDQRIVLHDQLEKINEAPTLIDVLHRYKNTLNPSVFNATPDVHSDPTSITVPTRLLPHRFKRAAAVAHTEQDSTSSSATRPVAWLQQGLIWGQQLMSGWLDKAGPIAAEWSSSEAALKQREPTLSSPSRFFHSVSHSGLNQLYEQQTTTSLPEKEELFWSSKTNDQSHGASLRQADDRMMELAQDYLERYDRQGVKGAHRFRKARQQEKGNTLAPTVPKHLSTVTDSNQVPFPVESTFVAPSAANVRKRPQPVRVQPANGIRTEKTNLHPPSQPVKEGLVRPPRQAPFFTVTVPSHVKKPLLASMETKQSRIESPKEAIQTSWSPKSIGMPRIGGKSSHTHRPHQGPHLSQVRAHVDIPDTLLFLNVLTRAMTGNKDYTARTLPKKIQKGRDRSEKVRLESSGFKVIGKMNNTFIGIRK